MFSLIADEQKARTTAYWSSSMEDTNYFSSLPVLGAPHPSFTGNKQVSKACHTEGGFESKKNGMQDERKKKKIVID